MAEQGAKRSRPQRSSFSAKEMFADIDRGPPRVITCAVKRCEADETVVMISQDKSCVSWLEVPESHIERYVYVGQMACADHHHAVVTLYLHPPQTAEGELFLMASRPAGAEPQSAPAPLHGPSFGAANASIVAASGGFPAPSYANYAGLVMGNQPGFFQPKGPCVYDFRYGYVYPGTITPCP